MENKSLKENEHENEFFFCSRRKTLYYGVDRSDWREKVVERNYENVSKWNRKEANKIRECFETVKRTGEVSEVRDSCSIWILQVTIIATVVVVAVPAVGNWWTTKQIFRPNGLLNPVVFIFNVCLPRSLLACYMRFN